MARKTQQTKKKNKTSSSSKQSSSSSSVVVSTEDRRSKTQQSKKKTKTSSSSSKQSSSSSVIVSTTDDIINNNNVVSEEIIVEILSRLPIKSLLRCMYVCKSWLSLISSDPYFLKSYNSKNSISHHHHHQLGFIDSFNYRNKLKFCGLSDVLYDKSVASKLTLGLHKPVINHVLIAGPCNGLLCIVVHTDIPVIVNPLTGIQNRLSSALDDIWSLFYYVLYGFGYDQSSDDYKLVALSRLYKEPNNKVKIYSLKTGKWKEIGDSPPRGCYAVEDSVLTYSNGALHWVATPTGARYENPRTIVSLDLATETFGQVLQPEYDEEVGYNEYLSLGALGERLCVLISSRYQDRSDIWVMNVYGVKDSWIKLVSVPIYIPKVPLFISDDGKILFNESRGGLAVYDIQNGSHQKIIATCEDACVFVASFVSPHLHRPASCLDDMVT